MTCSKCYRVNNVDARFCDWCGAQPEKLSISMQCTQCRTDNDPNAKFCITCGFAIGPPVRVIDGRVRNDGSISASSMIVNVCRFKLNKKVLLILFSIEFNESSSKSKCNIKLLSSTICNKKN